MSSDEIDALLERYLALLDEYTTLRNELSTFQSQVYQNIARANFSAERGLRYGQDFYDDRMQASLRVCIEPGEETPVFSIINPAQPPPAPSTSFSTPQTPTTSSSPLPTTADASSTPTEPNPPLAPTTNKSDPIRWFGLITPSSLKTAQAQEKKVVGEILPRLVSVDAEMREVEIRIRRARKWLGKGGGKKVGEGTEGVKDNGNEKVVGEVVGIGKAEVLA